MIMARGVNQKAISLKVDKFRFIQLERFCEVTKIPRNRAINDAIKMLMDDFDKRPFAYM